MKPLKMFGLAAAVAMALALLGAGSASATVLCSENAVPCPVEKTYPAKTNIAANVESKTSLFFKTTGGSTTLSTCTGGRIEGETENQGEAGKPVIVNLQQLSFFECTMATMARELGKLEIDYIGPETRGTFTIKKTKVTVNTAFGSCVYGAGESAIDIGTAKGAVEETPATLTVSSVVPKLEGSAFCPADVVWEASYSFAEPKPLYFKDKKMGE